MRRRDALGLLLAGAALPTWAQSAARRVAWVSPTLAADGGLFLDALRLGLRERGYVEGRNLVLEAHWGDGVEAKLAELVPRVLASKPEVVVSLGPTAVVLRAANSPIPVVFGYSGDPVDAKLVQSLARPGGNFTGITFLTLQLVGKRVELLKEALPGARRVAVIANPQHPGDSAERRVSEHAAKANGLALEYFEARNGGQLMEALAAIERAGSDAVLLFRCSSSSPTDSVSPLGRGVPASRPCRAGRSLSTAAT